MFERCWDFQNNSKEHFVFLNILRESRNLTWFLQCLRWTKQQQKESFEHNSEHGGVYINITFCHLVVVFFFFLLPFFVNWHRASWLLEKGIGGKRTLIPTYWECITFIIASSTHIQLFFSILRWLSSIKCPLVYLPRFVILDCTSLSSAVKSSICRWGDFTMNCPAPKILHH